MWLDHFSPVSRLNPTEIYHYRLVSAVLLSVFIYAGLLLLLAPGLTLRPAGERMMIEVCTILLSGTAVCLLILRFLGNLKISVSIFMLILLVELTSINGNLGGLHSPAVTLLLFLPALGTVILGYRVGLLWTVILLGIFTFFFLADKEGYEFANILAEKNRGLAIFITTSTSLVLISTVILYYEITIQKLHLKLQQEHDNYLYQANHDSLTHLANRRHFIERLQREIGDNPAHQRRFAILFFDLNNFKQANDTMDHLFGDDILKEVALRLKNAVRKSDLVARWGGDEFAMLLGGVDDLDMAEARAQEMKNLINQPMTIRGIPYEMETSVGYALYPIHGQDQETLIHHSDQAMYENKKASQGSVQIGTC